ncbi:hypothetical protein, partial [Sphingobacterium paucimobilis]
MGKLESAKLTEVSGMITSHFYKNTFWVHNDSGDGAAIYLIDSLAQLKASVELEGVTVIDAEDIASLFIDGIPYLLLADMGNNLRDRDTLSLYLFREPVLTPGRDSYIISRKEISEIKFRYTDKRRDAEALFVDPVDNKIYIISKRDFRSTLFSFTLTAGRTGLLQELSPQLELPFTFATGADISEDGRYIVIKNLTSVFLWKRNPGQDILSALKQPSRQIPYEVEPQGEAICFDRFDSCFYTISEQPLGLKSYLYKYKYEK